METEKNKSQKKLWIAIIAVVAIIVAIILFLLLGSGKEYTVTFDDNGGSGSVTESVREGKVVEKPTEPVKEGYRFLGWYLDDEEFDFSKPIKKNIKLIAKWEKIADGEKEIYNVKFDDGNEIQNAKTNEEGYVKELSTPVKEGYQFLGWYLDDEEFDFSKPVTRDMTLVAKWEKIKEANESEEVSKEESPKKENPKTPSSSTKPNNQISNSTTSKPNNGNTQASPQVQMYTVTFTVDGKTTSTTIAKGAKIALPEKPTKEGYTFKGWFAGNNVVTSETVVNENMNVSAVWDTYTFETVYIDNDDRSPNVLIKAYKNNQVVSITAIYGNLNGNANYKLGQYSATYDAVKVASKEQLKLASNYKIEINGNKVYAGQK